MTQTSNLSDNLMGFIGTIADKLEDLLPESAPEDDTFEEESVLDVNPFEEAIKLLQKAEEAVVPGSLTEVGDLRSIADRFIEIGRLINS